MNNLSSYCGLTDARMKASEKDLQLFSVSVSLVREYLRELREIIFHKIRTKDKKNNEGKFKMP